jgi:elongator complex protein 5
MNKSNFNISGFVSSCMTPNTSIVLLCHKDIPFSPQSQFSPDPLALLRYLATAILTVHSLTHIIAQKKARDRSVAEPVFGLDEGTPGVIVGLGSNYQEGTVIEMEHRRKSGRTVKEWFFVYHTAPLPSVNTNGPKAGQKSMENVIFLEDHSLYPRSVELPGSGPTKDQVDTTFNLELSEKERRDRDAVLLPYFDAQKEGGVGEGGRILYDMGAEDDFDDEEDEI